MNQSHTDTLKVPGATLHYEGCGSGPVLLCIPGGPADGGGFAPLRDVLADRYTVVTYDPRGLSRSPFDGEPQDTTVQTFADDAHRLLEAVGGEPAYVLGSSGGGLVGLELVSEHPGQVRVLVAHEPPCTRLLDDADEHVAFSREVHDTYLAEGVGPAMGKFMATAGLDQGAAQPPVDSRPAMDEAMGHMQGNMDFFLGHMWLPLGDYVPDTSQLSSHPIVVAVGEHSEGQLANRAARALAEQLGQEPTAFPGDHGWGGEPEAFASRLHEVLTTDWAPAREERPMSISFPGESNQYRAARDRLLEQEIDLRRATEAVASARRELPPGGVVPDDYVFRGAGEYGIPTEVRLSELFAPGRDSLAIYSFMFPRDPDDERPGPHAGETALPLAEGPCPSCTAMLDQLEGAVEHASQHVNLAVVAKAPLPRILAFAEERGWRRLRFLSSAANTYNPDYLAETAEGAQRPMLNVFRRDGAVIRHFWGSELFYAPTDSGQDPRHVGTIEPLWNLFDLTPEGRPTDWDEQLRYS